MIDDASQRSELSAVVVVDETDVQLVFDWMLLRDQQPKESSTLLQPYHCISITTIVNLFLFPPDTATTDNNIQRRHPSTPRFVSRSYAAMLLQQALLRYDHPMPQENEGLINRTGGDDHHAAFPPPPGNTTTTGTMLVTTCQAVTHTVASTKSQNRHHNTEDTVPCTGTNCHSYRIAYYFHDFKKVLFATFTKNRLESDMFHLYDETTHLIHFLRFVPLILGDASHHQQQQQQCFNYKPSHLYHPKRLPIASMTIRWLLPPLSVRNHPPMGTIMIQRGRR